jgi:hypothetical protein
VRTEHLQIIVITRGRKVIELGYILERKEMNVHGTEEKIPG